MLRSRTSRRFSRLRPATQLQRFLLNRRLPLPPGCFPVSRRILRVIPAEQQLWRITPLLGPTDPLPGPRYPLHGPFRPRPRRFRSASFTSASTTTVTAHCFYFNDHFRDTHRFQRRSPQPHRAPRRRLASWSRGLRPLSLLRVRAAFLLLQASHRVELCVKTILPSYLPVLRDKYHVRNYGANMLLMFEPGFANTESTFTLPGAGR